MVEPRILEPAHFLTQDHGPTVVTFPSLLILNQPIADFAVFARLWRNSKYRICADGGANRLHDMFKGKLEAQRADYVRDSFALYAT
jgi:thiamine pyrophosphokinase